MRSPSLLSRPRTPPAPLADLNELQSGAHAAALSLNPDGSLRITPGVVVSAQGARTFRERGRSVGETLDLAIPFPEETRVAAIADLDGGLSEWLSKPRMG